MRCVFCGKSMKSENIHYDTLPLKPQFYACGKCESKCCFDCYVEKVKPAIYNDIDKYVDLKYGDTIDESSK